MSEDQPTYNYNGIYKTEKEYDKDNENRVYNYNEWNELIKEKGPINKDGIPRDLIYSSISYYNGINSRERLFDFKIYKTKEIQDHLQNQVQIDKDRKDKIAKNMKVYYDNGGKYNTKEEYDKDHPSVVEETDKKDMEQKTNKDGIYLSALYSNNFQNRTYDFDSYIRDHDSVQESHKEEVNTINRHNKYLQIKKEEEDEKRIKQEEQEEQEKEEQTKTNNENAIKNAIQRDLDTYNKKIVKNANDTKSIKKNIITFIEYKGHFEKFTQEDLEYKSIIEKHATPVKKIMITKINSLVRQNTATNIFDELVKNAGSGKVDFKQIENTINNYLKISKISINFNKIYKEITKDLNDEKNTRLQASKKLVEQKIRDKFEIVKLIEWKREDKEIGNSINTNINDEIVKTLGSTILYTNQVIKSEIGFAGRTYYSIEELPKMKILGKYVKIDGKKLITNLNNKDNATILYEIERSDYNESYKGIDIYKKKESKGGGKHGTRRRYSKKDKTMKRKRGIKRRKSRRKNRRNKSRS